MSDPNDEPSSNEPPIEQRNHRDRTLEPRREEPESVIGGFILAVLLWAAVGFYNLDKLRNLAGVQRPRDVRLVALFFAVATCAVVALIVLRKDRRYLLLGLLLGTAIAGLIEGICFMSP